MNTNENKSNPIMQETEPSSIAARYVNLSTQRKKIIVIESKHPRSGRTTLAKAIASTIAVDPNESMYVAANIFMSEMIYSLRFNKMREFREKLGKPQMLIIDDIEDLKDKEKSSEEMVWLLKKRDEEGKQTIVTRLLPEGKKLERRLERMLHFGNIVRLKKNGSVKFDNISRF